VTNLGQRSTNEYQSETSNRDISDLEVQNKRVRLSSSIESLESNLLNKENLPPNLRTSTDTDFKISPSSQETDVSLAQKSETLDQEKLN
jgi:hypothetical protein